MPDPSLLPHCPGRHGGGLLGQWPLLPYVRAAGLRGHPGAEELGLGPVLGYQAGRLLAYGLVGGALGLVGAGAGHVLQRSLAPATPWILVVTLLAARARPGTSNSAQSAVSRKFFVVFLACSKKFSPLVRASVLGGLTPLLPCGLLYGVFAASIAAGSFGGGAAALGAFGLGAIPALLLAQLPARQLLASEGHFARIARRAIPGLAALVLAARAYLMQLGPACH